MRKRILYILIAALTLMLLAVPSVAFHVWQGASTNRGDNVPAVNAQSAIDDHVPALHQVAHHTDVTTSLHDTEGEEVALDDIRQYVLHNFGTFAEHPSAFGSAHLWPEWNAHWAEYDVGGGHVVHVLHITNKHDHSVRYLSHCDSADGHYRDWELVR